MLLRWRSLSLGLPMPNPARGLVRVRLGVPAPQPVRVSVHDVLGRKVAVVFDGLAVGEAVAASDAGPLAAGAYIVRARGAAGAVSRQISVVR